MLTGKNALVTGASRGIGRQIALTLAAAHAFVIVNYNGSKEKADAVVAEIKAAGGDAVSYQCNVSDFDECQNMITALIKEYKPDIVITDIKMNSMDGLEMLEEIKKFLECEFIVISGYSVFEYAQMAINACF